MGNRKTAVRVLAGAEILCALVIILVPLTVFPVCEAPMHCHQSYMAEIGTAGVVISAALMMILAKGMEAPRMLSLVTAVAGIFIALYPSTLIGVCGSPRMPCHYGLLPVWNLMGGALVLLSVIVFFVAREERP
jgi:hypothetical protein